MISNHWRNLRALPPAQSDEYQLVKRNSTTPLSKDEIVDRFAHWNPLVPDLLASPGGKRAFPPVRNLRIRRHANMRMSRTFAVAAMAWLVLGLLAIGIPIARGKAVDGLAFAMLAFAAFFFSEHHALRRRKPLLLERALYFRHVLAAPGALRVTAAVLLALTAVFGLQQWAESQTSHDAVLSSWAMIRGDLLARPYTLVTGPLLHGGFTHFANNLLLLAAILPLHRMVAGEAIGSILFLALLGAIGAVTGGAKPARPVARVVFWGALAMAVTAGIGRLVGTAV